MTRIRQWWHAKGLQSDNVDARLRAVARLATSTSEKTSTLLVGALRDPDPDVQSSAATALGKRRDPRAIGPLIGLLGESDLHLRQQITGVLSQFEPSRTTPQLLRNLESPDMHRQQVAASTLRKLSWDQLNNAQKAHVAILLDEWTTVTDLGADAVGPVGEALREGTPRKRRQAAEALGTIGTHEAFQTLLDVLIDTSLDKPVRQTAAWALRLYRWSWGDESSAACAAVLMEQWDEAIELGGAAVAALTDALTDPTIQIRLRAIEALGSIATRASSKAIISAVEDVDQDIRVRETAVEAIGFMPYGSDIPALVGALEDPHWQIRAASTRALARRRWRPANRTEQALSAIAWRDWDQVAALGDDAVKPLIKALNILSICLDAAQTLARIRPAGVEALVGVIKSKHATSTVREVVGSVLASIGDPHAVDPLVEMLKEDDLAIRLSAVWKLEQLGWEPTTPAQQTLVAMAHGDWPAVVALGTGAIEPLIQAAVDGMAAEETARSLEAILDKWSARMSIIDLRDLMAMEDLVPIAADADDPDHGTIDCSKVRQLAKFELIRRGITC